jgi:transcriptional regulator with XRE-family HTH domain
MTINNRLKEFLKTVGMNLHAIRVAQKKDIKTVAKAMEIQPAMLDEIEKGECNWDVELIGRLCSYYNVTPADIATKNKFPGNLD